MRLDDEWLEADGLGGFASGTISGVRTRRYHALLLHATTPPTGRLVLVNGFDAWIETDGGRFALTAQRYSPDVTHPDGAIRIAHFEREPWPRWLYRLENGLEVVQQIVVARDAPVTVVHWSLRTPRDGVRLIVRPFLSGRDTHATHHENASFRFDADGSGNLVRWQPYSDLPAILSIAAAEYDHAPEWYRNFRYDEERVRGLDFLEDLASPGTLTWRLDGGEAAWIVAAESTAAASRVGIAGDRDATTLAREIVASERARRSAFPSPLHRAADSYIARRGTGSTIIAGFPWFSDWGRDTFIAMRGLCLATGRLDVARSILLSWAGLVSEGMLPNYFPEQGRVPEYNSVDASLWYVCAVYEYLQASRRASMQPAPAELAMLTDAVTQILEGHVRGTRFGIHADDDGLLAAGEPGQQLTWMDARVDGREITPRIGKPVEVQALWINALRVACGFSGGWELLLREARSSFVARFWSESRGWLCDVVDADHVAGRDDATFRPNQILAVGGLPFAPLRTNGARTRAIARQVVDAVEARLWTPLGLRTLAPGEPGYTARYEGGVAARDGVYHQGPAWPWLLGPFVEAWTEVRGATAAARDEARRRFLAPWLEHLDDAGVGHVSELTDAEPPFTPRGAPFQAWSLGELLRIQHDVLGVSDEGAEVDAAAMSRTLPATVPP